MVARKALTRPLLAAAALAAAAALGAAVYATGGGESNDTAAACANAATVAAALDPLATGEVAAFQVATRPQLLSDLAYTDAEGRPVTLAGLEGKIALVNIWATWCAPCRREMPALDRLQAELGGEEFQVVPISIDTGDPARPREFLDSIGIKHLPLYTDPSTEVFGELKSRSLALGLPVTIILDRNGCHLGHMNGPAEWDAPEGRALIEAAVAESA